IMPPPSASVAGSRVMYCSNCTVSRLKEGVERFARLFAITSIERRDASCCERPTKNVFSTFRPLLEPERPRLEVHGPCHRESSGKLPSAGARRATLAED